MVLAIVGVRQAAMVLPQYPGNEPYSRQYCSTCKDPIGSRRASLDKELLMLLRSLKPTVWGKWYEAIDRR
jgi:hypothetical protein